MAAGKSIWSIGYVLGVASLQPASEGLECQAKHFGCKQLKGVWVGK